jgi:hypothetical protein
MRIGIEKLFLKHSLQIKVISSTLGGGNFNAKIHSGIVHRTGILLNPYISIVVSTGLGDYAKRLPFDTAPSTGHPIID